MARVKGKSYRNFNDQVDYGDGYVFYNRLDQSGPGWAALKSRAVSDYGHVMANAPSTTSIGDTLIRMGYAELAKEKALIRQVFGIDIDYNGSNFREIIELFNEMLNMKTIFERSLGLMKQSKGKELSPAIAATYGTYLAGELVKTVELFCSNNMDLIVNGDYKNWEAKLKRMIENDAITALRKMLKAKSTNFKTDELRPWQDALAIFDSMKHLKGQFKEHIYKMYGLDSIFNSIREQINQEKEQNVNWENSKLNTKDMKGRVNSFMDINPKLRSRSLSGFIAEYVGLLIGAMPIGDGTTIRKDGATLKDNIATPDNIYIFSANFDIDPEEISKMLVDFNDSFVATDKADAAAKLQAFYDKVFGRLSKGFIIYENTKAYGFGANFKGFHGGGTKSVSDLPSFLNMIGIDAGESLVTTIYNTIPGAINDNEASTIYERLTEVIAPAIAYFLFDDFDMIGVSTNNAIHVFRLSDMVLPLSFFLIKMGETIKQLESNPRDFIDITFKVPGAITYPYPITDINNPMLYYWNEQAAAAKANSTFTFKFLSGIKGILSGLGF